MGGTCTLVGPAALSNYEACGLTLCTTDVSCADNELPEGEG